MSSRIKISSHSLSDARQVLVGATFPSHEIVCDAPFRRGLQIRRGHCANLLAQNGGKCLSAHEWASETRCQRYLGDGSDLRARSPFRSIVAFRGATPVAQSKGESTSEGFLQVTDCNGEVIRNRRTNSALDLMCGLPDGDLSSESFRRDAVAGFEQIPGSSHPGGNSCQYHSDCGLPTIVQVANVVLRFPYGDNRSRRAMRYEFSASAATSARPPKGPPRS